MLSYIRIICLASAFHFLLGCGEKPEYILVGGQEVELSRPAKYCDSNGTIMIPIGLQKVGVFKAKNVLRTFMSCDGNGQFLAVVTAHNPDERYSDVNFSSSMFETFKKLIEKDQLALSEDVKFVLEHDEDSVYLGMMSAEDSATNKLHNFVTVKTGMTVVKEKVLVFTMIQYSVNSIAPNDFSELKTWISEIHHIN